MKKILLASLLASLLVAPAPGRAQPAETGGSGDATEATQRANTAVRQQLPFADREDFEFAQRGLIAKAPATVAGRRPRVPLAWNLGGYTFIAPAPLMRWRRAAEQRDHAHDRLSDLVRCIS